MVFGGCREDKLAIARTRFQVSASRAPKRRTLAVAPGASVLWSLAQRSREPTPVTASVYGRRAPSRTVARWRVACGRLIGIGHTSY